MSIHDNVFDLLDALSEQRKREQVHDWFLSLDDFDRQFYMSLARYLERHPERRAALKADADGWRAMDIANAGLGE